MATHDPEKVENAAAEPAEPEAWNVVPDRPRKVYGGMWGRLEIGVVGLGSLAMLAALFSYFFFLLPSNSELASNKSKATRLEAERISAQTKYGEITDTRSQVGKVLSSVDDFETRFLPAASNGRNALYQRLNGLILSYGLVNTTGPDYAPLETIDQNAGEQTEEERGRAKFRSLYPGVYVTTTVEGTYQNLRRFVRDIETGNEFIIVSAIELSPSDTEGRKKQTDQAVNPQASIPSVAQPGGIPVDINQPTVQRGQNQPAKPRGKMHGDVVALHIEMAAYFRRPNFTPIAPTGQ